MKFFSYERVEEEELKPANKLLCSYYFTSAQTCRALATMYLVSLALLVHGNRVLIGVTYISASSYNVIYGARLQLE